jgi:hypothetical protein
MKAVARADFICTPGLEHGELLVVGAGGQCGRVLERIGWSREFGFQGTRMSINGTMLEDFGAHDAKGV